MQSVEIDDSSIAYKIMNQFISEDSFDYNEDEQILSQALVWMIMNHLSQQGSFSMWYKSTWWVEEEDLTLINKLQHYEEKGIESFKEVLKYVFDAWQDLDDKSDFNMEETISQYEGESQ